MASQQIGSAVARQKTDLQTAPEIGQ